MSETNLNTRNPCQTEKKTEKIQRNVILQHINFRLTLVLRSYNSTFLIKFLMFPFLLFVFVM